MSVSLKPPEGCSGAGIGQLDLVPNENGIVEVPDGVEYEQLLDHGFTPCTEADLVPIRIKAQQAEDERIEALVQKRLDEILKGNAFFGRTPSAVAEAAPVAAEPASMKETDSSPAPESLAQVTPADAARPAAPAGKAKASETKK